jgi:hypothetical protein
MALFSTETSTNIGLDGAMDSHQLDFGIPHLDPLPETHPLPNHTDSSNFEQPITHINPLLLLFPNPSVDIESNSSILSHSDPDLISKPAKTLKCVYAARRDRLRNIGLPPKPPTLRHVPTAALFICATAEPSEQLRLLRRSSPVVAKATDLATRATHNNVIQKFFFSITRPHAEVYLQVELSRIIEQYSVSFAPGELQSYELPDPLTFSTGTFHVSDYAISAVMESPYYHRLLDSTTIKNALFGTKATGQLERSERLEFIDKMGNYGLAILDWEGDV